MQTQRNYVTARSQQDFWDRLWKDKDGNLAIWQRPNVWLLAWAALTFISLFFIGKTSNVISFIATLFLAIWSILEIVKGDSYFRRLLGLGIMFFVVASILKTVH